jgi:hypothetical protein
MHMTLSKWKTSGLLPFTAWFLIAFIGLLAVWGYITPIYNYMVSAASSPIFGIIESDNVTAIKADKGQLWVGRHLEDGSIQTFLYFDPYIYFGIIPLVALLIAVPKPSILKRLQLAAIGIVILFVVHVIYVIGSIELTYIAVGLREVGPINRTIANWAQVLLRIVWQISPILVFALLSAGFWRQYLSRKPDKERLTKQIRNHELSQIRQAQGGRP